MSAGGEDLLDILLANLPSCALYVRVPTLFRSCTWIHESLWAQIDHAFLPLPLAASLAVPLAGPLAGPLVAMIQALPALRCAYP